MRLFHGSSDSDLSTPALTALPGISPASGRRARRPSTTAHFSPPELVEGHGEKVAAAG